MNNNSLSIVITGPTDSLERTIDASDLAALKRGRKSVMMLFDDYIAKATTERSRNDNPIGGADA